VALVSRAQLVTGREPWTREEVALVRALVDTVTALVAQAEQVAPDDAAHPMIRAFAQGVLAGGSDALASSRWLERRVIGGRAL
jgi:hypothetical protein